MSSRIFVQIESIYRKEPTGKFFRGLEQVEHKKIGENRTEWILAIYPGRNDIITISKNGESKNIRVDDDPEYTWRTLRTKIKAAGGAKGFFDSACKLLNGPHSWYYSCLNSVWNNTKGV